MKTVVDMSDVMKGVNMEVEVLKGIGVEVELTVTRWFRFRLWAGLLLFRLAGWVAGCMVNIKII